MHIRTFIGASSGDLEIAIEQAEQSAQALLDSLSRSELIDLKVQSISDGNGYLHIITVVYE